MRKISRRDMLKLVGLSTAGAVLAACAPQTTAQPTTTGPATGATTAATASSGKPTTITMVESWFAINQDKTIIDPINKALSEKMQSEGVNIEIQSMVLDNHDAKYPLLYSSGADFTMAFDAPWYKMDTLRVQGALAVCDDLFNEVPNLEAKITPKILGANKWDGHWYGLPTAGSYGGTAGVIIRYDLLQKYNVAEPDPKVGWSSLQPYLEAIAKNEPTLIPFVVDAGYGPVHENFLLPRNFHAVQGVNTKTGITIPNIDKGYTFLDMETIQEYIDTATLVRSWWEAGLINKTDLTMSGASGTSPTDYLIPGKTAAVVENSPEWKYFAYQQSMASAFPDAKLKGYDMSGGMVGRNGIRPIGALKQWNFIVYNAGAPKAELEAGVKFFDWLWSSQDNIDLWLMGIDGTNYKKEDNMKFSEIAGVDQSKNYRRAWYVGGVAGRFQRYPVDLPADGLAEQTWEVTESAWDFDPNEGYNVDLTADNVQTLTAQIQAAWAEAYHGFGTGQTVTADAITKLQSTLDAAGRKDYMAAIQKQLNAYIAANKAA